jgi:hypothetical protein
MADQIPGDAERPTQFRNIGAEIGQGLRDAAIWNDAGGAISSALAEAVAIVIETLIGVATPIAGGIAKGIARGEDRTEAAFGELASVAIADALGVSVPSSFGGRGGRAGRSASVAQMSAAVMRALIPLDNTTLTPATEPSTRYMAWVLQMGLEGWLEGWIFEMLTSIPYFPGIETFAELDDILARVLGLERITRSVLAPYVDSCIVTPAEWHCNRTYRPKLLSVSETVRQFTRGRWNREQAGEELARQGYSEDRIEALIAANKKRLSASQVIAGIWVGLWDEEGAVALLIEDGYDDVNARRMISIERAERLARYNEKFASAAISAYQTGAISDFELDSALAVAYELADDRNAARSLAEFGRAARIKELSESDLEAAVKRNIITMSDYRDGLARLGYSPDAAGVLELLLRDVLNDAEDARRAKAARDAELAAERERKRIEAAARKAALEAERAVTEPSLRQIERAVIRGLLPMSAYETFLRDEKYSNDTIGFLIGLLEADRVEYVADQERRATAAARAARSQIAVAQLERAVERGLLSVDEYRAQLADRGLPAGDVDLLVRLADDRREQYLAAQERRAEAEARAAQRGLSLAQLERAVLRGVVSLDAYAARLADSGFDASDVATLRELLRLQLEDVAAAEAKRAEAEARARNKGLSLTQMERAVLRGVRSLDDYRALVASLGFAAGDVATLADLLQLEVRDAEAARVRQQEIERQQAQRPLTLAQVRQAVIAELVTLADYGAYLLRLGYQQADVDVLVSLAMLDLQEAEAARERRNRTDGAGGVRTATIAQVERAVRSGVSTLEEYRAALVAAGYAPADRDMLIELLTVELAADAAARQRRAEIERERSERQLSLSQAERAVRAGTLTLTGYRDVVIAAGYDEADQAILVATLAAQLAEEAARAGAA